MRNGRARAGQTLEEPARGWGIGARRIHTPKNEGVCLYSPPLLDLIDVYARTPVATLPHSLLRTYTTFSLSPMAPIYVCHQVSPIVLPRGGGRADEVRGARRPMFMLTRVGWMKRPDLRLAWQGKLAIAILIFILNAIIIFYIIEFRRLLCRVAYHGR